MLVNGSLQLFDSGSKFRAMVEYPDESPRRFNSSIRASLPHLRPLVGIELRHNAHGIAERSTVNECNRDFSPAILLRHGTCGEVHSTTSHACIHDCCFHCLDRIRRVLSWDGLAWSTDFFIRCCHGRTGSLSIQRFEEITRVNPLQISECNRDW